MQVPRCSKCGVVLLPIIHTKGTNWCDKCYDEVHRPVKPQGKPVVLDTNNKRLFKKQEDQHIYEQTQLVFPKVSEVLVKYDGQLLDCIGRVMIVLKEDIHG